MFTLTDIYENGKEFFRSNIEEKDLIMKEKYKLDYDRIINWWKPKQLEDMKNFHSRKQIKTRTTFLLRHYGYVVGRNKRKILRRSR